MGTTAGLKDSLAGKLAPDGARLKAAPFESLPRCGKTWEHISVPRAELPLPAEIGDFTD